MDKVAKKPKLVPKEEVTGSVSDATIQSALEVLEAAKIAEETQVSAISSALTAVASSVGPHGDGLGKHFDHAEGDSSLHDGSESMPTKQELLSDINSFVSSVDW